MVFTSLPVPCDADVRRLSSGLSADVRCLARMTGCEEEAKPPSPLDAASGGIANMIRSDVAMQAPGAIISQAMQLAVLGAQ